MYKSIMITAMNPIFVIQIIISTTLLVNQLCTPSLYAVAAPTAPLVGHLVPHSHCDAANEKTPDEYYRTQVRTILSSIVTALNEDSNRKFIWSETIFLEKWFHEVVDLGDGGEKIELSSPYLSEEEQIFQKQLRWDFLRHYQNENIEIVNGGWVMHDEAITRYDSQVMQMTYGHKSLQRMFDSFSDTSNEHAGVTKRMNLKIRTGWQIDSSGASQFSASLHPQAFPDFRVLILNKLPQTIKDEMKSKQKLEFHWEIYQDPNYNILLGKDCTINGAKPYKYRVFVHVLDTNYTSHAGYDWESIEQPSEIISDLNVMEKSGLFMDMIRQKSEYYTTNNVFIPFGGDFRFQNAKLQFENMEKIMQYVNDHSERFDNATLRFSTVNEYMNHIDQAVNSSNLTQGEDFFPTVSFSPLLPHWTGYYTQFPILKQMVRTCEQLLRTYHAHFIQAYRRGKFSVVDNFNYAVLSPLLEVADEGQRTIALMQHHDAITATSDGLVLAYYMKRLEHTFQSLNWGLSQLLTHDIEGSVDEPLRNFIVGGGAYLSESLLVRGAQDARTIDFDRVVDPTIGDDDGVTLIAIHSNPQPIRTVVHFVCTRSDVVVVSHRNGVKREEKVERIESQATPLDEDIEYADLGLFVISFEVDIEGLGMAIYNVEVCNSSFSPGLSCAAVAESVTKKVVTSEGLHSMNLDVVFNSTTNDIQRLVKRLDDGSKIELDITHNLIIYNGDNDTIYEMENQNGPNDSYLLDRTSRREIVSAYKGPLFSDLTLRLSEWFTIRYRLYSTQSLLQISVKSNCPNNTNIASRFQTSLIPSTTWTYKENGYSYDTTAVYEPSDRVGDNFRPLVTSTSLEESEYGLSASCARKLAIHSIDPRGVLSHKDGGLEIIWQRRNTKYVNDDLNKIGNDKSTSISSIWVDAGCVNGISSSQFSMFSDDAFVLSAHHKGLHLPPPYAPISPSIPDNIRILSLTPYFRAGLRFDFQVENLSEWEEAFQIESLFPNPINVELFTLTFLSPVANGDNCYVGSNILGLAGRQICSITVIIGNTESRNENERLSTLKIAFTGVAFVFILFVAGFVFVTLKQAGRYDVIPTLPRSEDSLVLTSVDEN